MTRNAVRNNLVIWSTVRLSGQGRPNPTPYASIGFRTFFMWLYSHYSILCQYPRRGPAVGRLGPWAPAFGDAGLGRLGEWRTPGPSRFRFFSALLFAPMRECRTVRLSIARQCGAAGPRLVTWFYLFVVCYRFAHCSFPFFLGTSILLLTLVSLRGVVYLPEFFFVVFVFLPYLLSPLACKLVFGHDWARRGTGLFSRWMGVASLRSPS